MRKLAIALMLLLCVITSAEANIILLSSIPNYQWQKKASFPDWLGRTDDTLALNSMMSFTFWHGQGKIYLRTSSRAKSFRLFINGHRVNTSSAKAGASYNPLYSGITPNAETRTKTYHAILRTLLLAQR